jgi:hypothetical protein
MIEKKRQGKVGLVRLKKKLKFLFFAGILGG